MPETAITAHRFEFVVRLEVHAQRYVTFGGLQVAMILKFEIHVFSQTQIPFPPLILFLKIMIFPFTSAARSQLPPGTYRRPIPA